MSDAPQDATELQLRLRAKLAELAPPGTPFTPELEATVRRELRTFLLAELKGRGLPDAFAESTATFLIARAIIKPKDQP